ncbi:hypothetical protein SCP_1502400 [Sparassis crispa]|uniref:DNA-directed DNA polymerase n=1 Tax=Sparassis crispa TaxID=139825 RepID=A0A401H490_9APHY|nr:hypothetical protein SCP_1502400 [Sparassis crispa]GBE89232.1 hypothetical protein SCP_1502400 [Sparassis crispa]
MLAANQEASPGTQGNMQISWCKVEATVSDPKDINAFSDTDVQAPKETPPLTVMSLSLNTIVNHKENDREIVCHGKDLVELCVHGSVSTFILKSILYVVQIDDPTPPEALPCSVHTFVPPLDRFPPNFEVRAGRNGKGVISPMKNEWMLLNRLLVTIHKADPDVIVGHEFPGVALDVFLHRMKELQADHWSRIGRFRRSRWPNIGRQGSNLRFINGRLVCDLASDGAKGMISSTTWSLTEMCKTHLKSERQDIDPDDTASYFDSGVSSPDRLLTFVRHCELDAYYQMVLAAKVQMLRLTRQLTNLAGNSWNKTLNGGRAERNEYILLHEFHRLKYICPDKSYGKKAATAEKIEAQDNNAEGGKATKGKRDKSSNPSVDLGYQTDGIEAYSEQYVRLSGIRVLQVLRPPLAALTTFKGREILTHTRELAESLQLEMRGVEVVLEGSSDYVRRLSMETRTRVQKAVNDRYKLLEIDLDGIFQRLHLLQEKRYVAIKVEDGGRPSTEVKGLDMKRRGYCALSKAVSQYVPDQILSGEATETVVERIHEYLTTMGEDIRAGKIKLDEFIIPEDHPNAKSQPHV